MTGKILNIPNVLTLARIVLIPIFLLIAYWPPAIGVGGHEGGMTRHIILTGLFVLAAITDWLDGYLARALNQSSAFGFLYHLDSIIICFFLFLFFNDSFLEIKDYL